MSRISTTLYSDPAWFAFPITIKPDAGFTRSDLTAHLENLKIETRSLFSGNTSLRRAISPRASCARSMAETAGHRLAPVCPTSWCKRSGSTAKRASFVPPPTGAVCGI